MKKTFKKLFYIILTPLLLIALMLPLAACNACTPSIDRLGHLVSEFRENIFLGQSESFSVTIISGKREDPFLMDGIASATRDFTLITITPKGETSTGAHTFNTVINGTQFKGEFVPHPFASTFSADLNIRANQREITLTIVNGNSHEESLVARSVITDNMIDGIKALEIAEGKLRYSLKIFEQNGNMNAEIYIRLLENPIDNSGGFYWYVAFVGTCGTIFAALIDSVSMQIIALRN